MSAPRAPAGHFTVLYFAAASSFTRKQHDHLPAPLEIPALLDELNRRYPGIKDKVLTSSALTVNLEYVDLDEAKGVFIQEYDEVAIIPPVSSG
ncbi:hypothetical protein AAFC00_006463 [Neodothiora populina]|uniref:Molybdopterin synthase sulfur carrier subunit n=1 Tax=Neodothiora populina TaxID=2781224 RepID=A0ABR3P5G5_9PEZI